MFQPLEKWLNAFTKNAKRHGNENVTCNSIVGSEGLGHYADSPEAYN